MTRRVDVRTSDVEHVVVHSDEAGEHARTLKVDHPESRGNCRRGGLDRSNLGSVDENGRIFKRRSAGTIDHSHVGKRDAA